MSFFKDFKADVTQAMNELMPGGNEMYNDDIMEEMDEEDVVETPKKTKKVKEKVAKEKPAKEKPAKEKKSSRTVNKKEEDMDIAPEDMLEQIDDLLDEELYGDETEPQMLLDDDMEVNTMDMSVEELLNQLAMKQSAQAKTVTEEKEPAKEAVSDVMEKEKTESEVLEEKALSIDDLLSQLESSAVPVSDLSDASVTAMDEDKGLEELLNSFTKGEAVDLSMEKAFEDAEDETDDLNEDFVEKAIDSVEEVIEESVEPDEESAEESVEPDEGPAEESVEPDEEPAEESVEPDEEPAEESVEPDEEPAEESVEPDEGSAEELIESDKEQLEEFPELPDEVIEDSIDVIEEESIEEKVESVEEPLVEAAEESPEPVQEKVVSEEAVLDKILERFEQSTIQEEVEEVMEEQTMSQEKDIISINSVEDTKVDTTMAMGEQVFNVDEADAETTYITKGTRIKGDLETDGSVDVIGAVEGSIVCKGKVVVGGNVVGNITAGELYANGARIEGGVKSYGSVKVGVGTMIIGNIEGESAVIAGAVNGDIDVHGPVIVDSTAVIMGNIKSRSVQINNGAVIEGFCSQAYSDIDVKSFFA